MTTGPVQERWSEFQRWVRTNYSEEDIARLTQNQSLEQEIYQYWFGAVSGEQGIPETPTSVYADRYIKGLGIYLDSLMKAGNLTETQAQQMYDAQWARIGTEGLHSGLQFYDQAMRGDVFIPPFSREGDVERFQRLPAEERRPDIFGQPNVQGTGRLPAGFQRQQAGAMRAGGLSEAQIARNLGTFSLGQPERRRFDPTRDIEFEPAIKAELAEFEGSRPWREWFERSFPASVQRFQRTLPEFKARWTGSRIREEKEIQEENWREFLEKSRSGFFDLSPFQRGERPQVQQPSIRTVGF